MNVKLNVLLIVNMLKLTQFAMQLKETNPKFDAMGLFNIDATLVYSVCKIN